MGTFNYADGSNTKKLEDAWRTILRRKRWYRGLCQCTLQPVAERLREEPSKVAKGIALRVRALLDGDRENAATQLLFTAVSEDFPDVTEALVGAEMSPDRVGEDGHAALHLAAEKGAVDTACVLLDAGADPNIRTETLNRTPLHRAARDGRPRVARRLVDAGAEIEATDQKGHTPLHLAARQDAAEVAKALIDAGANTEACANARGRPLQEAARGEAPSAARVLVEEARLDATDAQNKTPLHVAAEVDAAEVAEVLVDAGASLGATDAREETPLQKATACGADGVVQRLKQART